MKKQFVLLAVIVLVIAALIGGMVLLIGYGPEKPQTVQPTEAEKLTVVELDPDTVEAMTVELPEETYRMVRRGGLFCVEGIGQSLQHTDICTGFVAGLCGLRGERIEENAQSLADYGLAEPTIAVSLEQAGKQTRLLIGSDAPTGAGVYGRLEDSRDVWLLPAGLRNLNMGGLGFVRLEISAEDQFRMTEMTLGGTLREEPLTLKNVTDREMAERYGVTDYILTAPRERAAGDLEPMLKGILTITAVRAVAPVTEGMDLAPYGLEEPYSTLDITYVNAAAETVHKSYAASAPREGLVNFMDRDRDMIYEVEAQSLSWLETEYRDVLGRLQLLPNIFRLNRLTVEQADRKSAYNLHTEPGEGKKNLTITADGKNILREDFVPFYQNLLRIPGERYVGTTRPEGEVLLRIVYEYADGSPADRVELIRSSELEAWLCINGEAEFVTNAAYADIIGKNMEELASGQEITPLF